MTVSATKQYEITINNADGDLTAYAALLASYGLWSPQIFNTRRRAGMANVPLSHIAALTGDLCRKPLSFVVYCLTANIEAAVNTGRLDQLPRFFSAYDDYFIDLETWYSGGSLTRRMYVEFTGTDASPVKGTQYTAALPRIYGIARDPFWYETSATETIITVSAGYTNNGAVAGATYYWTQRMTTKIEVNINGQEIKDPTIEFGTSDGLIEITGSLTDIGDYWLVDHLNGTIIEHDASAGTSTNAIAKLTDGGFPSLAPGGETVTVTLDAGGDSDAKVTFSVHKRYAS